MNAELLLKHFERISDAPDAVPRLRDFVLDLAVRGKLVDSRPSDGSAIELLAVIRANLKTLGLHDSASSLPVEIPPFGLPQNWLWTRLGDICSKTGSGSTPRGGKSVYQAEGIPFLRSQNVHDFGLQLDDVAFISAETHERMTGTAVLPNDLLLNITGGSIGRCCIVPGELGEANVSQHVAIIRVAADGLQRYLHLLIRSPYFQYFVLGEQTGAGRGGLPKNRMDRIPVALPPFPEQQRIVARVNELMVLCDKLEAAQSEREKRRDRVVAASLKKVREAKSEEEARRDATFYFNHFPRLASRIEHVEQLRQTILDLAIRGQLVAPDPSSSSGHKLLCEIVGESRVNGASADRIELTPEQWASSTIGDCFAVSGGIQKTPDRAPRNNPHPYLGVSNVYRDRLDLSTVKEFELQPGELERFRLEANDILIVEGNGSPTEIGRCAVWQGEIENCVHQNHIIRCRPLRSTIVPFVKLFLNSPKGMEEMRKRAVTSSGLYSLSVGKIRSIKFPVPPLAEQQRIVARATELTSLCDQLTDALLRSQAERSLLLESLLRGAVHTPSMPEAA